jgi:pyruvate/2-oxoglutarate dehydrogenase complex dihydrolipoamide acyltransferase (E2) component
MRVPIVIPDCAIDEPGRLGEWVVAPGETVASGDCLAEYILPGLAIDLLAPASGIVVEQLRQPEQRVSGGEIVGWLEIGEDAAESA